MVSLVSTLFNTKLPQAFNKNQSLQEVGYQGSTIRRDMVMKIQTFSMPRCWRPVFFGQIDDGLILDRRFIRYVR